MSAGVASAPVRPGRAPLLLPLRVGYWLAALSIASGLLSRRLTSTTAGRLVLVTVGLLAVAWFVFYLRLLHRTTRVLEEQPLWWGRYSAAGIVWRQFIPFYNVYALWHWTRTAGEYVGWRLGQESKAGELAFWCIAPGLLLFFSDEAPLPVAALGMLLVMLGFEFLYGPVRRALAIPSPATRMLPDDKTRVTPA